MSEGTIQNFAGNSGRIKSDDGQVYGFNRKAIASGKLEDAVPGRRVRFRVDGERARDVVFLDQIVAVQQELRPSPIVRRRGPYRFLNPYNFVRSLGEPKTKTEPLLGRTSPPPHDRYVALTGRITCQLTATTPLFVSDSPEIDTETIEGKEHLHYRFFRDPAGNVAIPGTSLRGAIRSIFEAATNSCFAHFSGDKRLSYHLPPGDALKLVPARIRKVDEGRWELDLLPGTTRIVPNQKPTGPQYAAWVPIYRPLWASRTAAQSPHSPYAARKKLSLTGWNHGDPCQALIEEAQHPQRGFSFWNVVALARADASLPTPRAGQRSVSGYLCITNQNIENKHDERFFFSTTPAQPLELPALVRRRYQELIQDYQERHADEVASRRKRKKSPELPDGKAPGFSRFIIEKQAARLADGDLVYAMLDQQGRSFAVKYIVPVSVPRVGYEQTVGELLVGKESLRCSHYDQLCPACRTFGWVWHSDDPSSERPSLAQATAYSGRVRFSHARRVHDAGNFTATMAILSTPKPTTTRFYLAPTNGKPQDGLDDERSNFDTPGYQLRGRKIYRHHGDQLREHEYKSVDGKKSDQNRTLHGIQQTGTIFEFEIDFENLAPVELGALLWSLEMEGWHHRFGLGKPLGLGSATVGVTKLQVLDNAARFTSFGSGSGVIDRLAKKDDLIATFKAAMREAYSMDFHRLAAVRDLRALLAATPSLPVHYPRSSQEPQPEGKNYEWFVGNKRSGRNAGPRLSLPLAEDDRDGLPILDRFGEVNS
jgi:CRISPR-associated protein (TIGR03986 family)